MSKKWFFVIFVIMTFKANASPIVGSSANTLPEGKFMFEAHIMYMNFTESYSNDWIRFAGDSSFNVVLLLPQFYYGIRDFLTVRLTIPITINNQNFGVKKKSQGLGDIVLDTKYNFYKEPKISGFLGLRFPTGDKNAEISLGDGSTDMVGGVLITKRVAPIAYHIKLGYWLNGKGFDDKIFYNLTLEKPIFNKWAIVGELDGSRQGDKYILQFCPGIQYKGITGLTLEASFEIPVTAKGGFKYQYAPFIGLIYIF
ncbi:transporter [candidate division WOR-3 bacterium]|nr:transporter [candidate division WOR-3 bacterium]